MTKKKSPLPAGRKPDPRKLHNFGFCFKLREGRGDDDKLIALFQSVGGTTAGLRAYLLRNGQIDDIEAYEDDQLLEMAEGLDIL